MNIKEAKEMDLVDYLSKLGHEPADIKGPEYWYYSPFHEEKDPSFSVNRKDNVWYDFSEGKGGNLVDFGVLYHHCSVSELLQKLSGPHITIERHQVQAEKMEGIEKRPVQILSIHHISSFPLIKYLRNRRVPEDIADKYCQEVRYKIGDKTYYALGFRNNSGGYELRNEKFKGGSSPKDVTTVDNGAKELAVFEGFFDFLSYQKISAGQAPDRNFLILNSASFFERNLPFMQEHHRVHLYLDNDKTGEKYTRQALSLDQQKFKDERGLYQKYNDLNEWTMYFGLSQKQQLHQKP